MSDKAHQDGDGRNWLAAEFALGLLDGAALVEAAALMRTDRAFAAQVTDWQRKLSDLDSEFEQVTVPAAVRKQLTARLFGAQPSMLSRLWNSTPLWRGVAALGVAAAVFVSFDDAVAPPPPGLPDAELVTALFAPDSDISFITRYDAERAVLRVNRLSGEPDPGRDLELWFAPTPTAAPMSMGVVPEQQVYEIELSPEVAAQMTTNAHFGVSMEPEGGSTTGAPSGPVLVVADIHAI